MFSNTVFLAVTGAPSVKGWTGFNESMKEFFQNGMGEAGAKGLGIALVIIGLFMAALSFAMHHFNPQSRMPSWGICLAIAVVGAILTFGLKDMITFAQSVGAWIESLLGV